MRITTKCFVIILIFSGCHNINNTNLKNTATRHNEICEIMRHYWINKYETGNFYWWTEEQRKTKLNELRKMKNDYYYELSDPNIVLTIPGPGWEIKGPLSTSDNAWNKFIKEHREGDELYFFSSDAISWAYLRGRA